MWDVVFASHTAETGVFRVGSHHYSREFAKAGCAVTHVSSSITPMHLAKIISPDVRNRFRLALLSPMVDDYGVKHVVPILGLPTSRLNLRAADLIMRFPMKPWSAALGRKDGRRPDFLIIDQPLLGGLIDVLRPQRVIYRPTDAHFDPILRSAELKILDVADAVVATSDSVLSEVLKDSDRNRPTAVIENGVEFERFASAPQPTHRSGVVYVGALDKRFDWAALRAMAAAFPQESFHIAGPLTTSESIRMPDNVVFLGPVPYSQVPALLSRAKVGLLPMTADPANQGRSPMKYYEYLASGLSIVATRTETLSQRQGPGVYLYDSCSDPRLALSQALSCLEGNSQGVSYASEFSWMKRSQKFMNFLQEHSG